MGYHTNVTQTTIYRHLPCRFLPLTVTQSSPQTSPFSTTLLIHLPPFTPIVRIPSSAPFLPFNLPLLSVVPRPRPVIPLNPLVALPLTHRPCSSRPAYTWRGGRSGTGCGGFCPPRSRPLPCSCTRTDAAS